MSSELPVISLHNCSKSFSGRRVLHAADLEVREGEVHGLVGQNGSGKSTIVKILAGFHAPDPGARLMVRGAEVALPLDAETPRRLGMAFVHQHLALAEELTVLENLRVGQYKTGLAWRIDWRSERTHVTESMARFGLKIASDRPVGTLRDVERALIAILRALEQLKARHRALLVLDESTAYLPRDGADLLFRAIRDVASSGTGVLFVSHRLEEVRAVTDRVTILRDGVVVDTADTATLSERDLIARILGRSLDELYPEAKNPRGELALAAENICGEGVNDVSFQVRRGEIVGITGLLGMGHDRVLRILFGAERAVSGKMRLNDAAFDLGQFSPRRAMTAGIAFLSEDRLRQGAVAAATAAENLSLPTLSRYFSRGLLRRKQESKRVRNLMGEFYVQPPDPRRAFGTLSGGNQQKALVAKWFETRPAVLLLHEPTQGVDVGARQQIFGQLRMAAKQGKAIIIASTEYEDLAHLCDRVIVFRDGEIVSTLHGNELSYHRIIEQCFRESRVEA